MPKKAWLGITAAAVAVLIVALWFVKPPTDQTGPATAIRVGAIFPLTGDIASYGKAAKRGIDLGVELINARGGLGGRPVQVIYEDDQGQASKAVAAMQKLVSVDKVPLVMGSAASSVTLALCPIANREKVVLITPISSSKELTQKCPPFFFRVCPSDVVQASMMAEWFKEDGRQRAGIIFVNNSWGQGLKDEFVSRFNALGGQLVAEEAVKEGERDLRVQLSKIKAARPDALYAITYGREGGALLRQAKELGFNQAIYGADVWGSPELLETAQDAAKGVRIIVPAKFLGPKYQEFSEAFQNKYGEAPDTYASYAYDMAHLVASALVKSDTGDPLRAALLSTFYEGVTGLTKFDQHGDVAGKGFERMVLP